HGRHEGAIGSPELAYENVGSSRADQPVGVTAGVEVRYAREIAGEVDEPSAVQRQGFRRIVVTPTHAFSPRELEGLATVGRVWGKLHHEEVSAATAVWW